MSKNYLTGSEVYKKIPESGVFSILENSTKQFIDKATLLEYCTVGGYDYIYTSKLSDYKDKEFVIDDDIEYNAPSSGGGTTPPPSTSSVEITLKYKVTVPSDAAWNLYGYVGDKRVLMISYYTSVDRTEYHTISTTLPATIEFTGEQGTKSMNIRVNNSYLNTATITSSTSTHTINLDATVS